MKSAVGTLMTIHLTSGTTYHTDKPLSLSVMQQTQELVYSKAGSAFGSAMTMMQYLLGESKVRSPHLPRSSTWSRGQRKGSSRAEPGMVPVWGAHHRSAPHHMSGITSVLPSTLAIASAFRNCSTTCLRFRGVLSCWCHAIHWHMRYCNIAYFTWLGCCLLSLEACNSSWHRMYITCVLPEGS